MFSHFLSLSTKEGASFLLCVNIKLACHSLDLCYFFTCVCCTPDTDTGGGGGSQRAYLACHSLDFVIFYTSSARLLHTSCCPCWHRRTRRRERVSHRACVSGLPQFGLCHFLHIFCARLLHTSCCPCSPCMLLFLPTVVVRQVASHSLHFWRFPSPGRSQHRAQVPSCTVCLLSHSLSSQTEGTSSSGQA